MRLIKLLLIPFLLVNVINADYVDTGHAKVSIVKQNAFFDENNEIFVGIKMDMQKNWHTYWKNPGDSGGPLTVEWSFKTSNNQQVTASDTFWPKPSLIPYPPLMTYGYSDFVIFPFKLKNTNISNDFYLEANINFLICDDICVPESATVKTKFSDISLDNNLAKWINMVPASTLPIVAKVKNNILEIRFSFNEDIEDIHFFSDDQNLTAHSKIQNLKQEENNWLLEVPLASLEVKDKISGVLNINSNETFLIDSNIEQISLDTSISIFQALLFALIGGLILNLMPCVFPIISLKVLSFVSMGGDSAGKIRIHSFIFSLGVIATFLIIAGVLLFFRTIGEFAGWGFQLQSPVIVAFLCLLMFIIGLILLLDINIGTNLTKLGSIGSNDSSYFSSFMTGVLAVVVASPCTAPFMGAAIGYALIQPSLITIPVFLSLALGFAAPYLILGFKPALISKMPKPGEWMVTLREFLAFPMFATAIWLLWVFSLQTNLNSLVSLIISVFIISFLTWIFIKVNKQIYKVLLIVFGLILLSFQMTQINYENKSNSENILTEGNIIWEKDIEQKYRAANQSYLINFTAAWCITCQANDKVALSRKAVKDYLKVNDINYVVADWTNKDSEILDVLSSYGRSGVPLYVFWRPGMQDPLILPAILTEQILLKNLK